MTPKRLVVKVGTSTLTHSTGKLNLKNLELLAKVLSDIKNSGCDVILVSSGAISVGVSRLGLQKRPDELRDKQAAAAIGQCELIHLYDKFFGEYGRTIGQILLTKADYDMPERREHLHNTFEALLEMGVIPIVNENDSVAVDEIVIGDNDSLSAVVSVLCGADMLIILTDTDGFYDGDPRAGTGAKLIPLVTEIDDVLTNAAGGAGTERGTGGMCTKLQAAASMMENGIDMVISNGGHPELIYDILAGRQVGTKFCAKNRR